MKVVRNIARAAILVAVAATLLFAACSNSSDGSIPAPVPVLPQTPAPNEPAPQTQANPVTLATPLTLEAAVAGAVVTFKNRATGPVKYKVNGGEAQTIASGASKAITLENIGDKLQFFGDNETYATSTDGDGYSNIKCDKDCYVYGNIMSLVNSSNFESATTLEASYTFIYLFKDNAYIKNKDGANLLLPATTLANECYANMFQNCISLTSAPELPATTLANSCYYGMFANCSSLAKAPDLPATKLESKCYEGMFYGCTSLSSVTCLATNISETNCTSSWLKDVAASGTFKKAANMTAWTTGVHGIPSGWTTEDYQPSQQ